MNKGYLLIIGLVIVALGAFMMMSGGTEEVAEVEEATEEVMEEGTEAMEEGEAVMEEEVMEEGDEAMSNEVSFDVAGVNFAYDVEEIRVKQGDTVTINFVSTDGFHDWVVDEFDAATEKVNTGGTTSVTFTADQVGEFEYYCSVGSHRAQGMVGTLIVE